ncbi:AN1-type zinc finger protein 4 [Coelomomyces lativittatus]|nr:AN1-type zinc finger protein 4 [Coelomomyces lativittatus]
MLCQENPNDSITLSIGTLTGNVFFIDVQLLDTVYDLKSKFNHLSGIPISHQHLIYQDTELDDTHAISSYPLISGTRLGLVITMQVGRDEAMLIDSKTRPTTPTPCSSFASSSLPSSSFSSPPPSSTPLLSTSPSSFLTKERPATAILITRIPNANSTATMVTLAPRPHTTQLGATGTLIPRCHHCQKRVRYLFQCKCTWSFCSAHRHRHIHACSVDERKEEQKRNNKLQKRGHEKKKKK